MAKERLVDEIGQFASVPFSFLETKGISPYARCIFLFLRMHTNSKTKTAFPSYETLRLETGMTKRKISAALSELETGGWLVKQRRFAETTEYTLTIPKPALSNTVETKVTAALSHTPETAIGNDVETNAPYRELDRSIREIPRFEKPRRKADEDPPPAVKKSGKPPTGFRVTADMRDLVRQAKPNITDVEMNQATFTWNAYRHKRPYTGKNTLSAEAWEWDWIEWMSRPEMANGNAFNGNGKSEYRGPVVEVKDPVAEARRINCTECNGTGTRHVQDPRQPDNPHRKVGIACKHESVEVAV